MPIYNNDSEIESNSKLEIGSKQDNSLAIAAILGGLLDLIYMLKFKKRVTTQHFLKRFHSKFQALVAL